MPFFSIIIPTYNRANFIEKSIRSILNQSFTDFEVIVVDDGSTDNSEDIVAGISDPRLIYFKKKNEERGAARNRGAKISRGKYLNFFDSDDLAYTNHLETASNFIKRIDPKVLHLNFELQKKEKKKKSTLKPDDDLNKMMVKGNPLSCNGVFVLKEVFDQFLFNEDRRISGSEDYELWLRLASRYKIHSIPNVTSCIIDHDNRSVFTMDKDNLIERKLLMLDYAFKNKEVELFYGKYRTAMYAFAYSYISLHLAMSKKYKIDSINFFLKSLATNPESIFQRRSLAILKHLFK